jgi:thiamine pyrophosphate-dependent acetolactate synthase large subunit-like protein
VDLGGLLKIVYKGEPVKARIINASCDQYSHRAWSMEHQVLPPVDCQMMCEPDAAVSALMGAVKARSQRAPKPDETPAKRPDRDGLTIYDIAQAFNKATAGQDVTVSKTPIGWNPRYRHWRHPLDFLGSDGGGGLGSGPATSIGAALALRGTGRTATAILGDGDFLMGGTAVWTAVRYGIPSLMVISNNRGYFNDEMHQGNVARTRGRPDENKWIGQKLVGPDVDIAMFARSQGAIGIDAITEEKDLQPAIEQGLDHVKKGKVCVIDVRVAPGYED